MRFVPVFMVLLTGVISPAHAGVFTDDLSRCMVEKTSDSDKVQLSRWMFAAMSKDPSLSSMINISQADRDKLNKATADLFGRLMLKDCRSQTLAALKNEGPSAIGQAGQVLGSAAAHKLLSSPEADAELDKMAEYGDKEGFVALAKEAGITVPDK